MLLDSLPVICYAKCDPSTKAFLQRSVDSFSSVFNEWDLKNDDLSITGRIVRKFKNQQRHFIHFRQLCQLERRIRKASTGRAQFCVRHVMRCLVDVAEPDRCFSRNVVDFLLLALNTWHNEVLVIRSLAESCWKNCDRQMLTGHFVKLATLIMIVLSRLLILSEKSIASSVELYNSTIILRPQVPNVGVVVDYLHDLPPKLNYISTISLNLRCVAALNLPIKDDDKTSAATPIRRPSNSISALHSEMTKKPKKQATSVSVTPSNRQTPPVNGKIKNRVSERKELMSILRKASGRSSSGPNFLEMLLK
uniref:DUF4477 domain-containing protein n=2 Tax=Mesocestoides corti TaxID=53468 RepID=A0A5K3F4W9_MESCO